MPRVLPSKRVLTRRKNPAAIFPRWKWTVTASVRQALLEDVGGRDITTQAIVCSGDQAQAYIAAQAHGVVAGLPLVKEVFRQLNPRINLVIHKPDGSVVKPGDRIARLQGPAAALLTGERTALNFLGLLSGVATRTAEYVRALARYPIQVMDTRKTPPGLRILVKYAVAVAGGTNHRLGLYDAILIKDNHIHLAGSLTEAVRRIRRRGSRRLKIEVEAENLDQVQEALRAGVDIILLDNLSLGQIRAAMRWIRGRVLAEVSGNVNLATARAVARLGVNRVSVGALSHSAPWLAVHMEFDR